MKQYETCIQNENNNNNNNNKMEKKSKSKGVERDGMGSRERKGEDLF